MAERWSLVPLPHHIDKRLWELLLLLGQRLAHFQTMHEWMQDLLLPQVDLSGEPSLCEDLDLTLAHKKKGMKM